MTDDEIKTLRSNLTDAFKAVRDNEKNILDITKQLGEIKVDLTKNEYKDILNNEKLWQEINQKIGTATDSRVKKKSRGTAVTYSTAAVIILKVLEYLIG